MLLGLFVFAVNQPRRCGHSPNKTAEGNAREIRNAVQRFRAMNSGGCATIDELVVTREIDSASKTDDPWGRDYRIVCTDDEVTIVSAGKDGTFGNADDVIVPRRAEAGP